MIDLQNSSAYDIYTSRGIGGVITASWVHTLQHTPVSGLLKKTVKEPLHEQLIAFPTVGYWPEIKEPRSFNEKLMHRKLYSDEDIYTKISDKYRAREYVRDTVGPAVLTELYDVTDDPRSISFEQLPDQFAIKGTHGSSMGTIVRDKQSADIQSIISEAESWLRRAYGSNTKEYWYTNIEPRILVEEYIDADSGKAPLDYKFYVFHGSVEYVHVDTGRFSNHERRFYDCDWNPKDFELKYPLGPTVEKPPNMDRMIEIAETLGDDFDFMRVDLYNPTDNRVLFGELTVAPGSGHERFKPRKMDFELGSYW